jgi:unsaturated pyranuronate lyase
MPVINLKTIEKKELIPGYEVRFVHSKNMTIAFWDVKAGSTLPKHSHIHEQISQVTEGEFELTVEDKALILTKGKITIIPSNAEHSGRAITDCKIVDTFYPLREDYM